MAPDQTLTFVGDPCCSTVDFVNVFFIMITLKTLLTSPIDTRLYTLYQLVVGRGIKEVAFSNFYLTYVTINLVFVFYFVGYVNTCYEWRSLCVVN
jgi:hypothetical protein